MRRQLTTTWSLAALVLGIAACGGAGAPAGRLESAVTLAPAPDEVLDWISEHQIPIATSDPTAATNDLKPLSSTIGAARVVALGEATHGTREFFQLKHRMLEYLVTAKRFTVLAFEAGLPEARDVDAYVMGEARGRDGARVVAGLGYWPWMTEEVAATVEWMRAYNANPSHRHKVHFQGFDMQVPDRALRDVLAWLDCVDPPVARQYAASLHMATSRFDFFSTLDPDQLTAMQAEAEALLGRIDARRADYSRRSSPAEWTLHRQLARVVVQAITMTVADITGGDWDGSNLRDAAMAENLQWILGQAGPDGRVVMWAHNDHVAKGHYIPEYINMGSLLAARLGGDMCVLGAAFDHGDFQALGSDLRLRAFTVESGGLTTLDGTIAAAASPLAALPLGHLPAKGPVADWFAALPVTRSITAGYLDSIPDAYFYEMPVAAYYDALLFVANSARARPTSYARDQITPQATLPALANLGLESYTNGAPDGWFAPAANDVGGYRVEANRLKPYAGQRSAVLVRDPAVRGYGKNYGELRQRIDATPYRGKQVRLRAAVRVIVGNSGRAHLWMRSGAAYDGMHDRPITQPASWQTYDIVLGVSRNATTISFGLVLVGDGVAAIDDVSLTALP